MFIQIGERRAPSLLTGLLSGYLHLPDETEESTRITLIHDFLDEYNATGLTCVSYNLMAWIHNNALYLPPDVALWIAAPETLTVLRSKCLQVDVAREVGLPVLHSTTVGKESLATIAPEHFPLVLRPDDEAKVNPLFKMTLAKDQHALRDFLASRTYVGCALIGQRFINGPNLVVHGARTRHGEHLHQAGFMAHRKFGGTSLTIEPATLTPEIAEACRAFVERIGYVGIYHFDLLFEPESGDHYFLEINGRFGGTTGKVLACGYDEPRHLVEAFYDTGSEPHTYTPFRKKLIYTNKRRAANALLESIRGNQTIFDYPGNGSRWTSLALAWGLLSWRDEIFRAGHFRSALAYTIHALALKRGWGGAARARAQKT